jgi:hypothetical protein
MRLVGAAAIADTLGSPTIGVGVELRTSAPRLGLTVSVHGAPLPADRGDWRWHDRDRRGWGGGPWGRGGWAPPPWA